MRKLLALLLLAPTLCYGVIGSGAVWEIRANGTATGGGFYTSGGTDYSQQDAVQLTVTDGVSNGTTTITSATGGFTAAMVGNGIYITGVNDRYEIATHVDTNTITVDRTVTTGTGRTLTVGGAMTLTDANIDDIVAGNTVYVKADATHTLASAIAPANSGGNTTPIKVYGYSSTRGDNPTGTSMPLVATGTYNYQVTSHWWVNNLRFTGTGARVCYSVGATFARWINCDIRNSSGTADRYGFEMAGGALVEQCYITSTNGRAVQMLGGKGRFVGCVFDDSDRGVVLTSAAYDDVEFNMCIFSNCTGKTNDEGIYLVAGITGTRVTNCVFYNNDIGIQGNGGGYIWVSNTIFKNNTTGVTYSSDLGYERVFSRNNWHGNGTDVTNVTKGANALALDPQFTDAANGDFSIGTNMQDVAYPGAFGDDINTGYFDVGAVQREESGAAATTTGYGFIK